MINNFLQKFVKENSLNKEEKEYFDFHQHRYQLTAEILFLLPKKTRPKLLDVGSAYMHVSSLASLMGYQVSALDLKDFTEVPWLKQRALKYDIELRQCNLSKERISWPDRAFDIVLLLETLEHFNFNPLPVLQEIYRVLRPGGCLILTTPNLFRLGNKIRILFNRHISVSVEEPAGGHWREYSLLELKKLIESAGFKNFTISYFNYKIPTDSHFTKLIKKVLTFLFPSLDGNLLVKARKN